MKQAIVALLKAGVWVAVLLGVLSLQYLPDRFFGEHSVCGPWGCGAPPPALLACHGFWLVFFAPATVYAARRLAAISVWRLGAGLVSLAGLGLVAIAVWQAATWWQNVDPSLHRYAVERYLFVLATLVDVPVLETLLAGTTLWCVGIWRLDVIKGLGAANESPPMGTPELQSSQPL
jgi:hypothetical protein